MPPRKRKDHYATLGVKPTASDADIKRTYRSKAAKSHPDKGGNHEQMAELNDAYAILGDPKRRLLYDAGVDESPNETKVESTLSQLFMDAIQRDVPDIVGHVERGLKDGQATLRQQLRDIASNAEKLRKKRDKVSTTASVNLFHALVDQQLRALEQNKVRIEADLEGLRLTLTELKKYKNEGVVKAQRFGYSIFDVSATTGSTW